MSLSKRRLGVVLRYLEDSEDLKVSVTEQVSPLNKLPSRQEMRTAKFFLKASGKEKKRYALPVGPDGRPSQKVLWSWKKGVRI